MTGAAEVEESGVERSWIRAQADLVWIGVILAAIAVVFGVAVVIGMALKALPFAWGLLAAFALVVLVAAPLVVKTRQLWARLPR